MKANSEKIINDVCSLYGVTREELVSPSRLQCLFFARAMVGYFLARYSQLSESEVGKIINRHHSTISYYKRIYKHEFAYNAEFRNFANIVKDGLEFKTAFQEELEQELNEIIG